MTNEELKFIQLNGINPSDTNEYEVGSRKDLFFKLSNEYRQAFLKKFGECSIIDGKEVFAYEGELYAYCAPFGDGQYSSHFTFGVGPQEGRMGRYDENANSLKNISIPCAMCTEDEAKIFPVIKVEFKIEDGQIKIAFANEPTIVTPMGKAKLHEEEVVKVFDEDIIVSSLGFRSANNGELLIEDNSRFKSYNDKNDSIRTARYVTDPNPQYYSIEKLKMFLNGHKSEEFRTEKE